MIYNFQNSRALSLSLSLSFCLTVTLEMWIDFNIYSSDDIFFEHLKNEFTRKHSENDAKCVANNEWSPVTYIFHKQRMQGGDYVHLCSLLNLLFTAYYVTLSVAVTLNRQMMFVE